MPDSEHLMAVYCSQCDRTQRKVKHVTNCRLCGTSYLYECVACGKRYLTIKSAQTHIQHERERVSGKCPYCDHRASRKYNLRQHIMYKHTAIHPDDYYECDRCGAKLKSKEILVKHKARVCGEGQGVKCPLCSFRTKYAYYLKNHMKTQHEDVADGERAVLNEEGYNCLDCGKVFKAVAYLRRHQERFCIGSMQHGAQYKCEHCGEVCETKEEFMRHLRVVHADIVI